MAISKAWLLVLAFPCVSAWSREAASPSTCQVAGSRPAIAGPKALLDADPSELRARFALADAWSDAGCFNEALQVLQAAEADHPSDKELETRLRVARSLVREEHFFDNIDRANADAKFKRDTFRCNTLADLDACTDALRMKPDDPSLLIAHGDALLHAKRPADAINRYRLAAVLAPSQQRDLVAKINAAEAQLATSAGTQTAGSGSAFPGSVAPRRVAERAKNGTMEVADAAPLAARRYSNAAPETRSH